jgi:flavin reductase (DIM6/NTAB) family NADH-FMN oxidoreductase RutF/pimeloyl-ACP methyl ester carboxylesterase
MTLTTLHLSEPNGGTRRRVTCRVKGAGAPLVLIHGVGMQSAAWAPQLDSLATDYRVIALDMPGHGGSDPLPDSAELPGFVAWLHAVLAALDLGPVNLAGHSMGALIAGGYAVSHPDNVSRVALLNGVYRRDATARAAVELRAQEIRAGKVDLETPLKRWFGDSASDQAARMQVADWLSAVDMAGYATAYGAFARGDRTYADGWASVSCPMLALTGDGDLNSTPDMARAMAAASQNGEAVILPGHRHMVNLTAPEAVTEALRTWLQRPVPNPPVTTTVRTTVSTAVTSAATPLTGANPTHAKETPMTKLDPRALRDAFGTFMTGVTVVTACDKDGAPIGFTANSFSSVSLDPPLLLVCLARSSSNYDTLTQATGFGINVLAEEQKDVSNTFARPVDDRFAAVTWRAGPHGAPVFDDVSAWFDCSMHKVVEAGDHVILIGQVEAFDTSTAPGLGYARGAYVTAAQEAEALNHGANVVVSALIERAGEVLLLDDGNGGLKLPETKVGKEGATAALRTLIAQTGITAAPGFIYSVFEDSVRKHQHISFLCQASEGDPSGGVFTTLSTSTLMEITDPALRIMLERFASENQFGNYGVYFGDQQRGEVRPIQSGN